MPIRIRDFLTKLNETEVSFEDHIGVDQDKAGGATGDVKLKDFAEILSERSYKQNLVVTTINSNDDLVVNTAWYTQTGEPVKLNYFREFKEYRVAGNTPNDFQKKVNPRIIIDGQDIGVIKNPYIKTLSGSTGNFDRNTIGRGWSIYQYNPVDNFVYYHLQGFPTGFYWLPNYGYIPGFIKLDGTANQLAGGVTAVNFPNIPTYLMVGSGLTLDMAHASIAGIGSARPEGEIKQGQIQNITGTFRTDSTNTTGAFSFSNQTTVYNQGTSAGNTWTITFDASSVVNTDKDNGEGTLTKSIGLSLYYKT